jgi:hypothetical protein
VKWLLGAVVALVGLSFVGTAAAAVAANVQDTASTKAFIALQERYDIDTIRAAPAVNAAEHALVAGARSGCSNVLKAAPRKANAHQFGPMVEFFTEALLALNVKQLTPVRGISDRVGDQQRGLRFSDPALQWQVRVDGSALLAYVDLRPPDLCVDARALAASHFTKLTASGTRFVKDAATLFPLAGAPASALLRQMRPYAPAAVAVGLKRLPQLQRTIDQKLAFGRHLRALIRALGDTHLKVTSSALAGVAS